MGHQLRHSVHDWPILVFAVCVVLVLLSCSKKPSEPEDAPKLQIEWEYLGEGQDMQGYTGIHYLRTYITIENWSEGLGIQYDMTLIPPSGSTENKSDLFIGSSEDRTWSLSYPVGADPITYNFTYDIKIMGPPNATKQVGKTLKGSYSFSFPRP